MKYPIKETTQPIAKLLGFRNVGGRIQFEKLLLREMFKR